MPTPSPLDVDCLATGLLSGPARAYVEGRDLDLLAPLRFLPAGETPTGPAPEVDRAAVAAGLATANAAYGHPAARELAAKLADPATLVVATGQQTGVLGGPLLGWVKAAAAVRWAETLETAGRPAVAIFWMATEDHDWDEIARLALPTTDGLRELGLGPDEQPLAPVGLRTVGEGIGELLDEIETLYPAPWSRAALDALRSGWHPRARFGEAFARQLASAFGARAPLLVDAMLPELKTAERAHLERLVEARGELARRTAEREREIEDRGRKLQVAAQEGASPLFLLRGEARRRVEWTGDDAWSLRGTKETHPVGELLEAIRGNPAAVSPGALARPAIQDAVFGTFLQVMGPGELAYLPQAAPAYDILGLRAPWTSARPSALVLGSKGRRRLEALGVPLADLLSDPDDVERRLGERGGGGFVAGTRERIEALVAELEAPALAIDPVLGRAHRKTAGTVGRALDRFAGKVARAAARRDEASHDRLRRLLAECRPGGRPQERVVAALHFALRHGDGFGRALLEGLGLDPRRLSVIDPGETEANG